MKSALFFLLLSAFIVAVSCYPAVEEDGEQIGQLPWYNAYSYQWMMCRLKCRQSCLEQGYWKGVCKQGGCYCFGPMGPYGKANSFPVPMY